MKKELKEKIIQDAKKRCVKYDDVQVGHTPKVMAGPDTFWVEVWIKVPLDAIKS